MLAKSVEWATRGGKLAQKSQETRGLRLRRTQAPQATQTTPDDTNPGWLHRFSIGFLSDDEIAPFFTPPTANS
jgi:hypothetical protein